jgi:hypothetical protein
MTQEQLQQALQQVRQGIQTAQAEQLVIQSVLDESDREYGASIERLSRVGL